MAVVQAGWWVNGETGLDPARSQWALVGSAGHADGVVRLGALTARLTTLRAVRPTIMPETSGRTDPGLAWAAVADLPPSRLTMDVVAGASGRVDIWIGRAAEPWRTVDVGPGLTSVPLHLPAGAAGLVVEPDAVLREAGGRVSFVVDAAYPPVPGPARAGARYGDLEVFFLDERVFVEPAGFWVHGESAASFVVAAPDGRTTVPVRIQNGGVEQAVTVRVGTSTQVLTMAPSEARVLEVPLVDGAVSVRVESPSGFRPSDGGAADTRLLGVWVGPGG
jgi:hypothetical protein